MARAAYPVTTPRGVALAVCLVLLLVLSLMVTAGVRLSLLQLRISFNDQIRVEAFEQAQSLVDAALGQPANTAAASGSGVRCLGSALPERFGEACRQASPVTLPDGSAFTPGDDSINVLVSALHPSNAAPHAGTGYSAVAFSATQMRVIGRYDRNALGLGSAEVHQGLAIVRPREMRISITEGPGAP